MAEKRPRERVPVRELSLGLYQRVIDDTLARVKSEFIERGIDEGVIGQLRSLWETNISNSGAIGDNPEKEESESESSSESSESDSSLDETRGPVATGLSAGRPALLPGQPLPRQETAAVDPHWGANLTEASRKRSFEGINSDSQSSYTKRHTLGPSSRIPQQDGPQDTDGEEEELGSDLDDSEIDELNEEDDLADVDDHEKIDESGINNIILGQFERVHRSKSKWKVNLKSCIGHINGKDYLFKKMTGEMDFS